MVHDLVYDRYGSTFEKLQQLALTDNSGTPCELKVTSEKGVVYFECPDFNTGEPGKFPYMDWVLNFEDLEVGEHLGDGIYVRAQGLNKAVINLQQDLDAWVDTIKVPNTIKKGTRFNEIVTTSKLYTVADADEFEAILQLYHKVIKDKEVQFKLNPGVLHLAYMFEYLALLQAGRRIVKVHVLDATVQDQQLFNWISFELSNGVMYSPFMLTTRDPVLSSKYKPAIAAHIIMTKHAQQHGCNKSDYGHFYKYKSMLNLELEWVKGLTTQPL